MHVLNMLIATVLSNAAQTCETKMNNRLGKMPRLSSNHSCDKPQVLDFAFAFGIALGAADCELELGPAWVAAVLRFEHNSAPHDMHAILRPSWLLPFRLIASGGWLQFSPRKARRTYCGAYPRPSRGVALPYSCGTCTI